MADFGFVEDDGLGFEEDLGFTPDKERPSAIKKPKDFGKFGNALASNIPGAKEILTAGRSFAAGLRQEPSEFPSSPSEFITETIPQSAGRLTVGIPQFIQDVGKIPYNIAKTITDPALLLASGKPREALESVKHDVPIIANQANEMAKGLIEFGLRPVGIKPFPTEDDDFFSIDNLKEAYGKEPIETLLGAGLLKHTISGVRGVKTKPTPVSKKGKADLGKAELKDITQVPKEKVGLVDVDSAIQNIKKGKPKEALNNILDDVAIEKATKPTMSKPEQIARQIKLDAEAANIQTRKSAKDFLRADEVTKLESDVARLEVKQAELNAIRNFVKDPVLKAKESATVLNSIEGKIKELNVIVEDIKSAGKDIEGIKTETGIISKQQTYVDVVTKINEIRKLSSKSPDLPFRDIYKPIIDQAIKKLPTDQRVLLEGKLAKDVIKDPTVDFVKPKVNVEELLTEKIKGKKPTIKEIIKARDDIIKTAELEQIQTIETPIERSLLSRLTPEQEIRQVIRDRVINPLTSAELDLKHSRFSKAIEIAEQSKQRGELLNRTGGAITQKLVEESKVRANKIIIEANAKAKVANKVKDLKDALGAEDINVEQVPKNMSVKLEVLREKTGTFVKLKTDARSALRSVNKKIGKYKNLIECIKS